jgi:hypothetical protein
VSVLAVSVLVVSVLVVSVLVVSVLVVSVIVGLSSERAMSTPFSPRLAVAGTGKPDAPARRGA